MRIALVSREVHPHARGGIAPIVTATAALLSRVAEVTLFTSAAHRPPAAERPHTGVEALLPEVEVVWVEDPEGDEASPGGWYSPAHRYSARVHDALRRHYGARGPDLIEFPDHLAEGFVTIQDRHTGGSWLEHTTICVRLHTTVEIRDILNGHVGDEFATLATYDAERYSLQHADRILWPGGDVLGTYQRIYGALAPARAIPDAFLSEAAPEAGTGALPEDGDPLKLLYLGRLERRKGVLNLLRAVTALERSDWTLTLLGGDTATASLGASMRSQLELMAAGDPRIEFLDAVPRADVERHLRAAHVVVVPSLWECWPDTAREALMLNRPLLTTPVGGLRALAQPERSGWQAEDTSAAALGRAIEQRLDDRAGIRRLVTAGGPRQVFDELTDPERLLSGYRDLIADAVPRRSRSAPSTAPLVSIVVPYHRLERTVQATLESALAQTHPEVEVILVVDGSLRHEDAAVVELAERLGVTVVTQVNSGLGAARNFGISQSRGSYVLPLDADDLIAPEFVARCVDALERDPELAYVTTWVRHVGSDGEPVPGREDGIVPYGNWSRLIERNNVGGTCAALLRRELFDGRFEYSPDLVSYEDWLLYLELHHHGLHGAVIPERLFLYRLREDSMTREVGAMALQRLSGEVRAHARERMLRWQPGDPGDPGDPSDPSDRGYPGERSAALAADGPEKTGADSLPSRLAQALERLREANARLTRERLGLHDSAAGAILARRITLEQEVERLARRLETEIEVGRRNDEYFQAARAKLLEPHHRLAEAAAQRAGRISGLRDRLRRFPKPPSG